MKPNSSLLWDDALRRPDESADQVVIAISSDSHPMHIAMVAGDDFSSEDRPNGDYRMRSLFRNISTASHTGYILLDPTLLGPRLGFSAVAS